jgi:glucosamine--fructose-6-phosphate aminotransferase (isomerizing)
VYLLSDAAGLAEHGASAAATILMPSVDPFISPLITAVPIQLLAYHVALAKGTDVDQPRNLAKSVTVE